MDDKIKKRIREINNQIEKEEKVQLDSKTLQYIWKLGKRNDYLEKRWFFRIVLPRIIDIPFIVLIILIMLSKL